MHSFRSTRGCSARTMAFGGLIASAAVVCVAPAVAQSNPPTGEAIIGAMHDRYASTWYRTLTFTQKTTRRSPANTMVIETWKEKAMVPGKLRIDMEAASGNLSVIFANDSTYIMRADSVRRTAGTNYLLIIGFDVYRRPIEVTVAALTNHKPAFPMSPVHEDTWEGRPVYVIGAAELAIRRHHKCGSTKRGWCSFGRYFRRGRTTRRRPIRGSTTMYAHQAAAGCQAGGVVR